MQKNIAETEPILNAPGIKKNRHLLFWATLLIAVAVIVWLAPQEQTLGQGIKSVYVHASLIWVGMAGVVVAGLMGLAALLFASDRISSWMGSVGWVALAFYASGVGMSLVASKVNWGQIFWQEPRMRAALNLLALMLIVQITTAWLPWVRLRGFMRFGLLVVLAWSTLNATLVLHPSNPVSSSSSAAIKLTFLGLFILSTLAGSWLAWYLRQSENGWGRKTEQLVPQNPPS